MNRYHKHDGLWWFAMCEDMHTPGEHYEEAPPHRVFGHHVYLPLESVEITDALACSRNELGSVYVTYNGIQIEELLGANKFYGFTKYLKDEGVEIGKLDLYRIATPDELRAAGLWK